MSTITDQTLFLAPEWALELKRNYLYFWKEGNREAAYGVFHAGRLALEAQFGCSFDESTGFFHSEVEPMECSRFTYD